MSFEIQTFPPQDSHQHVDTIHDVDFDYYGKRVATCSSDKVVCIWDRTPEGWVRSAYWKKHGSAVWRVRFAYPEYGQILATCSFDNTVQIFDKDATESSEQISHAGFHMGRNDTTNGWSRRAILTGGVGANILDINFVPPIFGLRLAGCTANGKVMIWEADDMMAIENWNNLFNIDVCPFRLASVSWSGNRCNLPLLAVASDDMNAPANDKVTIFMINFNVGYGVAKIARYKFDFPDQVACARFGSSLGLNYHKLAVAAGSKVYVYLLQVAAEEGEQLATQPPPPSQSQQRGGQQPLAEFEITKGTPTILGDASSQFLTSQVTRLSWNLLGDILTAIYADGMVRIWKYTFSNKWILISEIPPPEQQEANRDTVYY